MSHFCPACGWPHLHEKPYDPSCGGSYEICPACGFQPGVTDDDEGLSAEEWRKLWSARGSQWHSVAGSAPPDWNPLALLRRFDAPEKTDPS